MSYAVMRGVSATSASVISRVSHGTDLVTVRLGSRRNRPGSRRYRFYPTRRFASGTPYPHFQEPRETLFPMYVLPPIGSPPYPIRQRRIGGVHVSQG